MIVKGKGPFHIATMGADDQLKRSVESPTCRKLLSKRDKVLSNISSIVLHEGLRDPELAGIKFYLCSLLADTNYGLRHFFNFR